MFAVLAVLVASAVQPSSADDPPAAVKEELKKLEGTWLLDHSLSSGGFITTSTGINEKLILKGEEAKQEFFGEQSKTGKVKIDPTKTPKTIDLTIPNKEGKARTRLGIYELDGKTLRISWAKPDAKERPAKFDREVQAIEVYKRVR